MMYRDDEQEKAGAKNLNEPISHEAALHGLTELRSAIKTAFSMLETPQEVTPTPFKENKDVNPDEVLDKLEHDLEQMKEQAESTYSQLGMSKEDVMSFMENPDNFTPEEWAVIQEIKEDVQSMQMKLGDMLKSIQPPNSNV